MADALKKWLRTRLGVIMDLTPETFGRYTRDGTLLAQILHSYDIINSNQLSTILRTGDPALSRVNLRTLRIWLKLINVTLMDDCIEEISKGKGAAALQLFYKVYLSLEGKDRLHFITLQKERKYMPTPGRFDVSKVSENELPYRSPEHPLSRLLIDGTETVLWYRRKFWRMTEAYRRERRQFEALMKYPVIEPIERFISVEPPDEKMRESERLDEFARVHPARKMKDRYRTVECCPGKRSLDKSHLEDPASAAEYIDFLKKRSAKAIESNKLKLKTQTTMMAEAWEGLLRKQDRTFDEALGVRVLDQSRYEKQMIRKLCEVRDLRSRIVENRRIVEAMLLDAREIEQRQMEDHRREIMKVEMEDVELEARRMSELRRRIREEKIRRMREKHERICLEITEDLADIAVKIADYREANDNEIPYAAWYEWKIAFLKNQPIFELVDRFNDIEETEDEGELRNEREIRDDEISKNDVTNDRENVRNKGETKIEDELKAEEKQRLIQLKTEHLAHADFESYRDLTSPWSHFVPKREETIEQISRLGRTVLGYVVHRLLEILYPYPAEKIDCPIARVKIAAIVSGIINPTLHEQLRELLKNSGIRLVRMEDAINHCLERYKREMADVEYIDLNIVSATARDAERSEVTSKTADSTTNHRARKNEGTSKAAIIPPIATIGDKQTQTPRQIPHDDMHPILSDTAYIGKWTYEFLTLGEPISNELNTKILIEYLKGLSDFDGLVLINYPNTYEQMAMLEKALTGCEVPPDRRIMNFAEVNVEDIDPPSPRIVFEDNDFDAFAICRQSRLLPNPISKVKDCRNSSRTFMTIYIKAMLKSKAIDDEEQACMPLIDDSTSMDEFYADQNIAYGFFYSTLDLPALKRLTDFITSQFPERKVSSESFDRILHVCDDEEKSFIDSKTIAVKRLISKSKWKRLESEEQKDVEINDRDLQPEAQTQPMANNGIRPGEDGWKWLDLPQSPALLEIFATLWESIEEAYVENLKEIFSLKRMHTSAVVPYKDLVMKNLKRFVDRPDERQILLQDFHRDFNEIDEDLREDVDMKYELHCRVDEFRTKLWELCDTRRHEAEEERRRILQNQWIPLEAVVLINVYIGILQTEIDRFIDTMQLLQDYYLSMSQKPLQESRLRKIVLDDVQLENIPREILSATHEDQTVSEIKTESIKTSDGDVNMDRIKIEIESLLIDVSRSFEPDRSVVYNIINANIEKVRNVVDSTSSMMSEVLKEEEKAVISKTEIKSKVVGNATRDSTFVKLTERNCDLVEEWRYAISFEVDRIDRILDVLNGSARSDIIFLLDTMRRMFHRVYDYIVERYKREIDSINEMANVFCFAIEERRPIQEELILNDQLIVRSNVLMFPEDPERLSVPIREAPSPLRFRMVQLGWLIDIFQRIAPRGTMSERGLVYVLQELVSCGEEDCYPPSVPCAWRQLRPPDIEKLIERLFGVSEYIEWREFILYAMDLPVPSHEDILKARITFKMHDPEQKEMISHEQFHSSPLWFLEISTFQDSSDKDFDNDDCDKMKNIMLRKEMQFGKRISIMKNDFLETSDNPDEILRLTLAKELLCRMYSIDENGIPYTAMLLDFCKDADPSKGLGKAFTLAMGAKVCTDVAEGERYVGELIAKKRRVKELKLRPDYLREEANEIAREIINYLMNKMEKLIIMLEKSREYLPKSRITIQRLTDELEDVDPAELLPPEVTAEHLVVEDSSVANVDGYESSFASTMSIEDRERIQWDERMIFWLPRDVCLMVLTTCLPWLASQANLFQTSCSLHEGIARAYDELKDEELNDEQNLVLAHRLVNHSFIRELLRASSKFVSKDMTSLLRNILKNRDDETLS